MNKDITIMHISSHDSWRGGEQQLAYLIQELEGKNCIQHIYCAEDHAFHSYCLQKKIEHYTFKKSHFLSVFNGRRLKRLCKYMGVDIIHVHDAHAHTIAFISALMGNKTSVVVSRRVDFPVRSNILSGLKYNHPFVSKYICVSEKVKEVLVRALKDNNKAVVVHSGIDMSRFQSKGIQFDRLLKDLGVVPKSMGGDFLVGNVASIADHKDYFTFVNAARLVLEKRNDVTFLIVGDGPLKDQIVKYIQKGKYSDKFRMVGFRQDVPEILSLLDVFLFTSKTEGLGTSLLDAMASRLPVVATCAGGIPELVKHEESALLSETGNAEALAMNVLRLIEDTKLRDNLIGNAYEQVKIFSKENMAIKTLQIYEHIKESKFD